MTEEGWRDAEHRNDREIYLSARDSFDVADDAMSVHMPGHEFYAIEHLLRCLCILALGYWRMNRLGGVAPEKAE